jgi:DNA-binding transcriptional regulator LsrR (DeoR family)
MAATGATQREIAQSAGIGLATVNRTLRREDVRALVEAEHSKLLAGLPNAREAVSNLISQYHAYVQSMNTTNLPTNMDPDDKKQAAKFISRLLESVGIFPSLTQSILVQQIYTQSTQSVPPQIAQVLAQLSGELEMSLESDDAEAVIDCTPSVQTD